MTQNTGGLLHAPTSYIKKKCRWIEEEIHRSKSTNCNYHDKDGLSFHESVRLQVKQSPLLSWIAGLPCDHIRHLGLFDENMDCKSTSAKYTTGASLSGMFPVHLEQDYAN